MSREKRDEKRIGGTVSKKRDRFLKKIKFFTQGNDEAAKKKKVIREYPSLLRETSQGKRRNLAFSRLVNHKKKSRLCLNRGEQKRKSETEGAGFNSRIGGITHTEGCSGLDPRPRQAEEQESGSIRGRTKWRKVARKLEKQIKKKKMIHINKTLATTPKEGKRKLFSCQHSHIRKKAAHFRGRGRRRNLPFKNWVGKEGNHEKGNMSLRKNKEE